MIGRAAKLDASRTFSADLLFEHLHQARFANARLTTEQYDLAFADLGLLPTSLQESEFFVSAHQRGQTFTNRRFKTAVDYPFAYHAVYRQGDGDALQRLRPQVLAIK